MMKDHTRRMMTVIAKRIMTPRIIIINRQKIKTRNSSSIMIKSRRATRKRKKARKMTSRKIRGIIIMNISILMKKYKLPHPIQL